MLPVLLMILGFLTGCAQIPALKGPDAVPVVLSTPALGTDLQRSRVSEPNAPYLPVVRPPDVLRVWVLARANEHGDLLQGYWWHLLSRDWAFEQVPTATVQSPTDSTGLPYSPLSQTPSQTEDKAEFGLSSSNTESIQQATKQTARGLPEAMKSQILKAIQQQSGGQ